MKQGEINYALIGQRIREKRQEAKLTQEELSEKLDVAPEYVSRIENGHAQVNLKRLGEISVLLDVPIEYFLTGSVYRGDDDIQALVNAARSLNHYQRAHLVRIAQEIQQLLQER